MPSARLGYDAIALGHRCVGVEQDAGGATVHLADPEGRPLPDVRGSFVVCCDGVHSVARESMHPNEAVPRYEGTTQYRGVTRWKSFLSGASMVYFGVKETGKLIIYPIRDNVDAEGHQLVNWVIEVVRPRDLLLRDWNCKSRVEEFIHNFEHCSFDWLDIPGIFERTMRSTIPMVDQDPLPFWTTGRITLLGDAAHLMMPRGSNGGLKRLLTQRRLRDCWHPSRIPRGR